MPAHPGTLTIPSSTAGHELFRLQQNHLIAIDKHQEAIEIKKALGRMIDNAVDSDLISDFLDDDTGLINKPIHEVMAHLYKFYGEVTRQDLKQVERDVDNLNYTLQQPPALFGKPLTTSSVWLSQQNSSIQMINLLISVY